MLSTSPHFRSNLYDNRNVLKYFNNGINGLNIQILFEMFVQVWFIFVFQLSIEDFIYSIISVSGYILKYLDTVQQRYRPIA